MTAGSNSTTKLTRPSEHMITINPTAEAPTTDQRIAQFEKKAIRLIAIGTALPGIVVAVLGILRFLGRL